MQNSVVIINTTRCNFHCKHCLREYYTEHRDLPIPILERSLLSAKEIGFSHAALTGGEPFCHPQFHDMISSIVDLGFSWSIVTNGYAFHQYDKSIENYNDSLKYVAVSLDGATEETHDETRQPGSFNKVLGAVDHFLERGVFVRLLFTVTSKNYNELPVFFHLAQELGVCSVAISATVPTRFNKEYVPSWPQKVAAHQFVDEIRPKVDMSIHTPSSLYSIEDPDHFCGSINDHHPAINPLGEYLFCCDTVGYGAVLGSLENQNFSQLFLKGLRTAAWLKEQRRKMVASKDYFPGFFSCQFCNTLLEERIHFPD